MLVGVFYLSGCTDESNIITPSNNKTSEPEWIVLPQSSGPSVETEFSVSGLIDGTAGGMLQIYEVYYAGPSGVVRVNTKLTFPKNCFPGTETITMMVDRTNGTVTYSPPMIFDNPAFLNLEFQGIDLSGIDPDSINFVYYNPNGYYETVEYNKLAVSMESGRLTLQDGKIPHFSRYGYSR